MFRTRSDDFFFWIVYKVLCTTVYWFCHESSVNLRLLPYAMEMSLQCNGSYPRAVMES